MFQSVRRSFGAAKVELAESTARVSQVYDRSLVCSVFCPWRSRKVKRIFREAKPRNVIALRAAFVRPFHSNIPGFSYLHFRLHPCLVSHLRFCLSVCSSSLLTCTLSSFLQTSFPETEISFAKRTPLNHRAYNRCQRKVTIVRSSKRSTLKSEI